MVFDPDLETQRHLEPLYVLGQPLEALSIEEIIKRIAMLKDEISRLEQDLERKKHSRDAANAFFKS